MRRRLVSLSMSLLLLTAGWTAVGTAQDPKPADAIPNSASIVIRCKSPQVTWGKAADIVDAVQPGFGSFVKGSLPSAGIAISNPGLAGIDTDKDIWAIVFAESQSLPTVVFMATAKDVDAAKKSLGNDVEIHTAGKVIIYSEDKDSLSEVRERLEGKDSPLWAKVEAASKKLFDESDISVLVNIEQLTEDFAEELKQAEPQLDAFIDQIAAQAPEGQQKQIEAMSELYRQLGKAALKGVHDSKNLTIGLSLSKTAIRIEDRLQVTAGTPTSDFFKKTPPADLGLINKLPAAKAAYIGVKTDMSTLTEWSMKFSKGMIGEMSAEQSAQFDASLKEISQLKYDEMVTYFNLVDEAPALVTGSVTVVSPTDRLRELAQKFAKTLGEIKTPGMTQTTKLESNAEKIGNTGVDRLTITQELDDSADPSGMQKKFQSLLFGDAGMQQLIMYQPKRILQTMGGGKAELQSLATAVDASNSSNQMLADARKRLVDKANLLAFVDVSRLVFTGVKLAGKEGSLPIDDAAAAKIRLEPSFVGFALTSDASGVRIQLEIPVSQAQNIAKLVPLFSPGR